jgi:proliferating cell nuclear antigen PCNA
MAPNQPYDPSLNPKRILEITTTQTGAIKNIFEKLREIIPETNITFRSATNDDNETVSTSATNTSTTSTTNVYNNKKDKSTNSNPKKSKSKKSEDSDSETTETSSKDKDKDSKEKESSKDPKAKKLSGAGIRILTTTKDRNILVNMKLDAENFDVFYCRRPKLTIGMDLNYLHSFLASISNEGMITFCMDEDNINILNIKGISDKNNEQVDLYINLLDITDEKVNINSIKPVTFDAMVSISSQKFHKMCKNLGANSTYVEIRSIGTQISFTGRGECGKITINLTDTDESLKIKSNDVTNVVQGVYELKALTLFTKCNTLCPNIDMFMKNNFPLVLKITVASLGRVFFFCTPINQLDSYK